MGSVNVRIGTLKYKPELIEKKLFLLYYFIKYYKHFLSLFKGRGNKLCKQKRKSSPKTSIFSLLHGASSITLTILRYSPTDTMPLKPMISANKKISYFNAYVYFIGSGFFPPIIFIKNHILMLISYNPGWNAH